MTSSRPDRVGVTAKQDEQSCPDAEFFSALMSLAVHQDSLMWSRVQIILAVQGGVLVGAYGTRAEALVASSLLVFGAAVTLVVLVMMGRDRLFRQLNQPLLLNVGNALAKRHGTGWKFSLELDPDQRGMRSIDSLKTNTVVCWSLILVDLALILIGWFFPQLIPN